MDAFDILMRLLLVLASAASFGPQLHVIRNLANCNSISMFYVLFNLIIATHSLALSVSAMIDWEGNFLVQQPPAAQDWLHVAQFAITWLGQLVLGYYVLTLPPHRPATSKVAVTAYLCFLAITLFPAFAQALIPWDDREMLSAILVGTMLYLLAPIVQLLGFAAMRVQAREMMASGSVGALSIPGLVIQAVVFLLVGISLLFRLKPPAEELDNHWIVNARDWYWKVGWATLNNIIFALGQAVLACIAWHYNRMGSSESQPLLS